MRRGLLLEQELNSASAVTSFAENKVIQLERGHAAVITECSDAEVNAASLRLRMEALEAELNVEANKVRGLEDMLRAERERRQQLSMAPEQSSVHRCQVVRLSEEVSEMLTLNDTLRAELVNMHNKLQEAELQATKWRAVSEEHACAIAELKQQHTVDAALSRSGNSDGSYNYTGSANTPDGHTPERASPHTHPRDDTLSTVSLGIKSSNGSPLIDLNKEVDRIRAQEDKLRRLDPSSASGSTRASDYDLSLELRAMTHLVGNHTAVN